MKSLKQSSRHHFSLQPKNQSVSHKQRYNVQFCKSLNHSKKRTKTHECNDKRCMEGPKFNSDMNVATPAFILPSDDGFYFTNGEVMKVEHYQKMKNYNDEKSVLNIPKPKSKNNYCNVCKTVYEDYLTHIQSNPHRKRIGLSAFNKHIIELTKKFSNIMTSKQEEQSVQIIEHLSQPKKKIKSESSSQKLIIQCQKVGEETKNVQSTAFQSMNQISMLRNNALQPIFPFRNQNFENHNQFQLSNYPTFPPLTLNYNLNFYMNNPCWWPPLDLLRNPYFKIEQKNKQKKDKLVQTIVID